MLEGGLVVTMRGTIVDVSVLSSCVGLWSSVQKEKHLSLCPPTNSLNGHPIKRDTTQKVMALSLSSHLSSQPLVVDKQALQPHHTTSIPSSS